MGARELIRGGLLLGGGWALWTAWQSSQAMAAPVPAYYPDPVYQEPEPQGGGLFDLLTGASRLFDRFGGFDAVGAGEEYDAFAAGAASVGVGDFLTPEPQPTASAGWLDGLFSGWGASVVAEPVAPARGHSHDVDILARTLWGEARGEGRAGMEAVAAVIMNRVDDRRWPDTPAAVCQQPWQFSCWNAGDPNRALMLALDERDRIFRDALDIAQDAVSGRLYDPTGGATHYHANYIAPPSWTAGARVSYRRGSHVFYTGVA